LSATPDSIPLLETKERTYTMSNSTSIQSLLIGKAYRSRSIQGIIEDAEPRDNVYYVDADAYAVRVRPTNGGRDEWRTLAVARD